MRVKGLCMTCIMLSLMMFAPVNNNIGMIEAQASATTAKKEEVEPSFSKYRVQDKDGNWKVKDNNGKIIKNAWLCDDAVKSNGTDVWYLLDKNGNMITAGLVQDGTGKYYSLETNHNGYYGMLRYKSGQYDGINLMLNDKHEGAFAAIMNKKGLEGLTEKYGVTKVTIDNSNCVYTSTFEK